MRQLCWMLRGRNETEWARAKSMTAWIRGAWVKEPMPAGAMDPYHRKVPPVVKLRLFLESMKAKHGGR